MAKKKFRFNSKFLFLPLLLTVLVLVGAFMLPKKQSVEPVEEKLITNNETEIEETIENGVYTNHTVGFRFEYDEELFPNLESSAQWSAFGGDFGNVWTSILVRQKTDPSYDFSENLFEEIYRKGEADISGRAIAENAETTDFGKYRQVVYEFRNYPDYEGEHSFAYKAEWKKNSVPVVNLTVASSSEDKLKKYRKVFDDMVNTFEFID